VTWPSGFGCALVVGVDLYLDQQAIDTTTPMGKLVFQLTGAFAEFERTMIRQRIKAGLKRAVAQGVKLARAARASKALLRAVVDCRHKDDGAPTMSPLVLSRIANNSLCSATGTLNFAIVSSKSLQKAAHSLSVIL
jgi:DNA invertase Pin-like site-specific DNA recombinase